LGRGSIVVTNVTAVFTVDRFVHVELKAERFTSKGGFPWFDLTHRMIIG
jgi:hypothetical protein